ncbi:MAG: VCBS repeat-containing protein [Candidatus Eisenbacteria bacterium]
MGCTNLRRGSWPCLLRTLGLALGTFVALPSMGWAIQVVSTTPSPYALGVDPGIQDIVVQFDQAPLLPPLAARVSGVMSGRQPVTTTVDGNAMTIHLPAGVFFPGEMVRVNLHRNIADGGGGMLTGGYYFTFTIAVPAGSGSWDAPEVFDASIIPYFIHGGDMNEDGLPDLAVPNEGTNDVSIFLNQGGSIGAVHNEYGVGTRPSSIFAEDLDNDGDLDLATADIVSGTMSVLRNNGDGTFMNAVTYASGATCRQVHGGDFDGDLDVDLCTTSRGTNQVFFFYNGGAGGFGTGQSYGNVATGPFTIQAEDYNLDGHLDIAVGCQDADRVTILLNDGTGGFSTLGSYATGNGPWDMVANDYDGDGDCDLLTVLSFGNQISVLRNDGTGAFPTRTFAATDAFPLGCHAVDIDGDHDIDAISANFNAGTANLFLNDGTGSLALAHTFDVNLTGSYPWASDLDGDGDLDISIVDENSDLLYIFYQSGVPAGSGEHSNLPSAAVTVRPQPMRIGDGADLLLRNILEPTRIDIVGPDGRVVRVIEASSFDPKNPVLHWDGRDQAGREVAPGQYFLSLHTPRGAHLAGQIVAIR